MGKLTNREYVTEIYKSTYLYITKYLVIKCADIEDVSDMLQNIYLNFLNRVKKRGQEYILSPKYLLLRIAKDEVAKFYKDKKIKSGKIESFDEREEEYVQISDDFLLEEFSENRIISDSIWNVIKQFDDITVKIFTLKFVYDMTLPEISKATGLSLSNVKNRLYRALPKVVKEIDS